MALQDFLKGLSNNITGQGGQQSIIDRLKKRRNQSPAALGGSAKSSPMKSEPMTAGPQSVQPNQSFLREGPVQPVIKSPVSPPKPQMQAIQRGASVSPQTVPKQPTASPTTAVQPSITPTPTPPPTFTPRPVDSQLQALRKQVLSAGQLSPEEEMATQERLDAILSGGVAGAEKIRTQPIATPFIRGQQAALERQIGVQADPLERQLARQQAERLARLGVAETKLGFREEDLETEQEQRNEFEVQTRQEAINDLINQGITDISQLQELLPGVPFDEIANVLETRQELTPTEQERPGFTLSPGQVRFDAQGNIVATGGPKPLTETETAKIIERQEKNQAARDTQVNTIGIINNLLANPDLSIVSGASRLGLRARLAGTADVRAQLSQLEALTSLGERDKLKGSGTISDFEATMLGNSANAINFAIQEDGRVAMSDEELTQNLRNIRGVLLAKAGEPVSFIATDPATGESRRFDNQTRQDIEDASLQGFIIDFE